jgi:hypothetical protein
LWIGSTAAGRIVDREAGAGVDRGGYTLMLFDGSDRYGTNGVAGEWIDQVRPRSDGAAGFSR